MKINKTMNFNLVKMCVYIIRSEIYRLRANQSKSLKRNGRWSFGGVCVLGNLKRMRLHLGRGADVRAINSLYLYEYEVTAFLRTSGVYRNLTNYIF